MKYLDDNGLLYLVQKIKTWLADKADSSHTHTTSEITDYKEYELPIATSTSLGGIKVGTNLSIDTDGVLSATDTTYELATVATTGAYSDLTGTPTIPTAVSELDNDSEYATTTKVSDMISEAIGDMSGLSYSIVSELPNEGETGVIYLLANEQTEKNNIYDEYIYVSSASSDNDTGSFEKIGTTAVDLSDYVQTSDIEAITNSEIDTICA